MRIGPIASNSVALASRRKGGRLAGLGVVCLFSVVGIVITIVLCSLGFRSEVTAALSDDMTGSIVEDQTTKAVVRNLAVQGADSRH